MSNEYVSHLLDVSVAKLCSTIGWTKTHESSLKLLSELMGRYLRKVAVLAKQSAELNNRTAPTMDDLAFVFSYLRIDLEEMAEYCANVQLPSDNVPYVSIPNGKTISGSTE